MVQDINDPIYQMQREAFTIQKEALSDFTVIGKGVCVHVCVYVCVCVRACVRACVHVCMHVCVHTCALLHMCCFASLFIYTAFY